MDGFVLSKILYHYFAINGKAFVIDTVTCLWLLDIGDILHVLSRVLSNAMKN